MIEASYIDHMGSDDRVVDAARVSFAKIAAQYSPAQNRRLIAYLAEHAHWTPFGHCQATVHVKAPIFVARQLAKHQVGMVWNEVSRRYVDNPPKFYMPHNWRRPVDGAKQGSSGVVAVSEAWVRGQYAAALAAYTTLIEDGVAAEQARMVLPQAMMTEWYWTGSLAAWARVCHLRLAPDAQGETRVVAGFIAQIMADLFPISWAALAGWRPQEQAGEAA